MFGARCECSTVRSTTIEKHLVGYGEVAFRLPDGQHLKLWSKGDDGISNAVFWNGWMGSERATAPVFYRLARQFYQLREEGAVKHDTLQPDLGALNYLCSVRVDATADLAVPS